MGLTPAYTNPTKAPDTSAVKGLISKLRGYKHLASTTSLVIPSSAKAAADTVKTDTAGEREGG